MIKRYHQFITESLDPDELKEYFIDIIDSGVDIDIENDEVYFEEKYSSMSKKYYTSEVDFEEHEEYQKLIAGNVYYKGFIITLILNKFNGDLTNDFKNSVSQIESLGFKLLKVTLVESDGYESTESDLKIDDIFLDWNNEENNEENSNFYLKLHFHSEEEIRLTDVDLAEYYCWTDWDETESKEIYFDISVQDIVSVFIKEKSEYYEILSDEDYDISARYRNSGDYSPSIKELCGEYSYLSNENIFKIIEIFIKNSNGWESFIEDNDDLINVRSKEEFFKEITRNRKLLSNLFERANDNELNETLIDNIRWTIGDYSSDAHAGKNLKEIWNYFYNMIGNHIKYEEIIKNETLRVYFQNAWVEESPIDLMHNTLESVFSSWVIESISDEEKRINPRLSDWGDVDKVSLNMEISDMLKNHK